MFTETLFPGLIYISCAVNIIILIKFIRNWWKWNHLEKRM